MKKTPFFFVVPFILALVLLTSCGDKSSPKSQVEAMFRCYAQSDFDKMSSYVLSNESLDTGYEKYLESNISEDNTVDFLQKNIFIPTILKKSKINVKSEKINGDLATVSATIECPDVKTIIISLLQKEDISELSSDEIERAIKDEISIGSITQLDFELNLKNVDNNWLVDLNHLYIQDALSGGLLSGYKELYQKALEEIRESLKGGN